MADLNGDAARDLVVTEALYLGTGGGAFYFVPTPFGASGGDVVAADLDADGDMDLLSAYGNSWSENLGLAAFSQPHPLPATTLGCVGASCAADLNDDGYIDVIIGGEELSGDGAIVWLENLFQPGTSTAVGLGCPAGLQLTGIGLDLGGSWDLTLSGMQPSLFAMFFFGDTLLAPAPTLAAFGAPGCSVYTSANLGVTLASVTGSQSSYSVPVPATPSLLGLSLVAQATGADPSNELGFGTSNGLVGVVGY